MSRKGFVAMVLLAGSVSFGQATTAWAASSGVAAPSDLGSVLAAPPDSSFKAARAGTHGLGSLDPMTLASQTSNVGAFLLLLTQEHFTRAYEKAWLQQGSGTILLERVIEFEGAGGANDHLAIQKQSAQSSPRFAALPGTPAFDLGAGYGEQVTSGDGSHVSNVVFVKGNLLFEVVTLNKTDAGTRLVLDQATRQHDSAPAATIDPNGFLDSANVTIVMPAVILALVALIGIPLLGVASAVRLIPAIARRRGRSRPEQAWWDGARWRSADGSHWFDGAAWRPVTPAT